MRRFIIIALYFLLIIKHYCGGYRIPFKEFIAPYNNKRRFL